ncbi:RdgB/HAM1 family non-canonical purine NTP pyrophosphatase [Rhodothermus marinus]|uniref:RdgB/HAM1 family non-canonical purine NTP pyrophosphatase n=1 Tax=Rhodothermus marinus TaxID=29549 RepID=UPI0012BA5148|nr:RdgB/HAM1 family non-canonical purine NTP pyrophosphatase [Rhodothermus marinus]BBM70684.1 non-canonical purine NTP pyrophosphatase [Rhodothermus marinus]
MEKASQPITLVLATRNPGKLAELQAMLAGLPVQLRAATDFPGAPEVEEDAATLEGNAARKARALQEFTGLPALADDTGLEVEALGGAPGVHSARFAGPTATDADNRALLLERLKGVENRRACFRTVLAFAPDARTLHLFEGICPGWILEEERGSGGFGYDPLFVPEGYTQTFAEMPMEEKNRISHRGQALRAFVSFLREWLNEQDR